MALYVFLNASCNLEVKIFDAYYKMENPYLIFFGPVFLRIAAGALICWLIIVTLKQEVTVRSAVAEFVIVGGFGLYLAAGLIIYFFIPAHITGTYPLYIWPHWLPLDEHMITMTIGGVLFGYELVTFIVRMVGLGKKGFRAPYAGSLWPIRQNSWKKCLKNKYISQKQKPGS